MHPIRDPERLSAPRPGWRLAAGPARALDTEGPHPEGWGVSKAEGCIAPSTLDCVLRSALRSEVLPGATPVRAVRGKRMALAHRIHLALDTPTESRLTFFALLLSCVRKFRQSVVSSALAD